jgi:hypothetical protein
VLGKRSIKTTAKQQGIRLAVSMVDLTTLEGADTPRKVRHLCAKAVCPLPESPEIPSCAAVDRAGQGGLRRRSSQGDPDPGVNAVADAAGDAGLAAEIDRLAAESVTRVRHTAAATSYEDAVADPLSRLEAVTELKTAWHPIGA